jgi:hypothetical protein
MRTRATRDPSVVEGIRSQVTRCHAVRIGIRPFGTKGSQVQILSPRPSNASESQAKAGVPGRFHFRDDMHGASLMHQTGCAIAQPGRVTGHRNPA